MTDAGKRAFAAGIEAAARNAETFPCLTPYGERSTELRRKWYSGQDELRKSIARSIRALAPSAPVTVHEAAQVLLNHLSIYDGMSMEQASQLPEHKWAEWEASLYISGRLRALAEQEDGQ